MKDLTMIGGGASDENKMNMLAMGLGIARVHLRASLFNIFHSPGTICLISLQLDQSAYELNNSPDF